MSEARRNRRAFERAWSKQTKKNALPIGNNSELQALVNELIKLSHESKTKDQ